MRAMDGTFPFLPELHLFHSMAKADKFIRKTFDTIPEFIEGVGAQTWCDEGVAIVFMACESDHATEMALLCHEAYHVVLMHYAYLGEEQPSEEFVAYGIQTISKALFEAHERWKCRQ